MAKRQSPADPPPNSDPFDSDIDDLNLDDLNIDDLRVEDVPETDMPVDDSDDDGAGIFANLTIGQIIGGAIQVIISAAVIFVILVALAAGGVFAAQRLGVVQPRGGSAVQTAVSALPTSSAPEVAAPPTATPRPTVVADSGCPQAAEWWNSQQVQSNYVYFTQQAVTAAKTANNIAALTEQMRIHRDFVANFAADSCLTGVKNALLTAFDATIAVARSTNANDQAALAQQQPAETKAYSDLDDALREVGIDLQAVTPAA